MSPPSSRPKENEEAIKKLVEISWPGVVSKCLFDNGTAHTQQLMKLEERAARFALQCALRVLERAKTSGGRAEKPAVVRAPPSALRDWPTMDRLHRVRPTVCLVGSGWKPADSKDITFVQCQGLNVINVLDQLEDSHANWSVVEMVWIVTDPEWSLFGSFTTFEKLIGKLMQRAPRAKVFVCKIPHVDIGLVPEKLEKIKAFNYHLGWMCRYSIIPIRMWHLDSILEEVGACCSLQKPQHLDPDVARKVMIKLTEQIEQKAAELQRPAAPPPVDRKPPAKAKNTKRSPP